MLKQNKALLVGGTFGNDWNGKGSTLADVLFCSMVTRGLTDSYEDFTFVNGGMYDRLEVLMEEVVPEMDYIFWFADVADNDKPKLVRRIKAVNKKCILVTSKRNYGDYEFPDLVQHALGNKSNLLVEFTGSYGEKISGRIIDPLGNLILDYTKDFVHLGHAIAERVKYLSTITRVGSVKVGDAIEVPNDDEFFAFVRKSANQFSELIPTPTENERFLGNASFRCQHGFPSFKRDGMLYISKRNIDKEYIGRDGFVAVNPDKLPLEYYGDHKPSVDAPIHVKLYDKFPKINYMIHGHVYIYGGVNTWNNVPCGGLEEVEEIIRVVCPFDPPELTDSFRVNLKGHGFIIGVNDVGCLNGMDLIKKYEARIFPERI